MIHHKESTENNDIVSDIGRFRGPVREALFEDVVSQWLEIVKNTRSAPTYAKYNQVYHTYLGDRLGKMRLDEITHDKLDNVLRKIAADNADASENQIKNIYAALNVIIGYLNDEYSLNILPLKHGLGYTEKEIVPFAEEEQRRLLFLLRPEPDIYEAAMLCSLYTGLRPSEVVGLKWADIDLDENVMTVRNVSQGRAGSRRQERDRPPDARQVQRQIPLSPGVSEFFRTIGSGGEYVFSVNPDTPIVLRTLQNHYNKLLKEAGIKECDFNIIKLRHTFMDNCVTVGIDAGVIEELLGYSKSTKPIRRRIFISMENKRDAMEALEEYYNGL